MNTQTQATDAAKAALREALATYGGDTKHEVVAQAIANLAQLNPTPAPARNEALMDGQWLLISAPNFPNGERRADGKYIYSLGRLAFNLFQPTSLKLAIDRVLQPVEPIGDGQQRTHDIIVEFTVVEPDQPPLQGVVHNFGVCQPATDDSLQVKFTGGALAPQDLTQLAQWMQIFGDQTKPVNKSFKEKILGGFLKLLFGIVPPKGINPKTGQVSFQMKRSPKGNLAILYLDEELRITRGEKGTVLVCERLNANRSDREHSITR